MACGGLVTLMATLSFTLPARTETILTTPDERRMVARAIGIAQDALEAGWPRDLLEDLVAVSMAETTAGLFMEGDLDKVGQRTPDGRTWGPSYGPMHVRSIIEETGTGSARDIERLRDPVGALSAALEIYEDEGWRPWSSVKSKRHLEYKPYAQQVDYVVGLMESGKRESAPPVRMNDAVRVSQATPVDVREQTGDRASLRGTRARNRVSGR